MILNYYQPIVFPDIDSFSKHAVGQVILFATMPRNSGCFRSCLNTVGFDDIFCVYSENKQDI